MRAMVTGFNTDVQHEGKVYHVQTEDKGRDNPIIESLVYRGGEILAARRSSYADRAERGLTEAEIAELIEAQHNAVIADVRAGTFDVKQVRPFGEGIISGRSFDEVVLDFLRSEIGPDPLVVSLIGGLALVEGTAVTLEILVTRGRSGDGVDAADVRVRLISTSGTPRVLAQGRTESSGRVALAVAVPSLGRGAGALIVQATSGKDSAEFKQVVSRAGSPGAQAANPGASA